MIDTLPQRFMVRRDLGTQDVLYDAVIGAIRSGLLARRNPAVPKKLAHENVQRIFCLLLP